MADDELDFPTPEWTLPRRELLKRLAGGISMSVLAPRALYAADEPDSQSVNGEAYWENVKNQFPLRPGLIMMNAANLCPTHDSVLTQFTSITKNRESDLSFQNRGKFRDTKERSRELLADYLSVEKTEIAITRNTSEGNNIIITGLDLGPGDEVVIWDQNHPSANLAWKERANRHGFTVKEVSTPKQPEDPEQLHQLFISNLGKNTKVFSASHVSNTTGIKLPVEELCQYCREHNIMSHIDGAQTFGALKLQLHKLGCDFYTGSMHKWPMGPKESGLLYVKKGMAEKVWPSIITVGYGNIDPASAAKFDNLGQQDDAIVAAIAAAIELHIKIGAETIENRLKEITDTLKREIETIPGSFLLTPTEHSMSAGIVIFSLDGVKGREGFGTLYSKYNIAAAPAGYIDGIRLSPHIYNTMNDIDKVISAVKAISA